MEHFKNWTKVHYEDRDDDWIDELVPSLCKDYDQLLADARGLQKALERARDRDFDWDLVHTKHSMEQLQVWRGKCLDAFETFTKKYGPK